MQARSLALALAVFASILFTSVTASAQQTRVKLKFRDAKGQVKEEDGQLQEWNLTQLRLKVGGRAERDVSNDDIVAVEFSEGPGEFLTAIKDWKEGNFGDAMDVFKGLEKEKLKSKDAWAREHVLYYIWDIDRRNESKQAESAATAVTLAKEYPNSHYIPLIELWNAQKPYIAGDFGTAEKALADFEKKVQSSGWSKALALNAGLTRVRALIAMNRAPMAADALKGLGGNASEQSRQLIAVCEGEVLNAEKKFDQAKVHFENQLKSISHETFPVAYAGAANGLGDACLGLGQVDDAIAAFARTFALYSEAPGVDDEVGWAHYRFYQACNQKSGLVQDEEQKKLWRQRANTNRQRAAEDYALTRGGQAATRELGR